MQNMKPSLLSQNVLNSKWVCKLLTLQMCIEMEQKNEPEQTAWSLVTVELKFFEMVPLKALLFWVQNIAFPITLGICF